MGETILLYATNFFWVAVAVAVIYYSNFFHNLFHNPKINELFFQVSITGYTIMVMFIIYTTFVLPNCMGVNSVEDYNPKLISVGLVVSIISILSLLVAIWPIWGFTSILIFIALLKGFFALQVFLPAGNFGNILFFVITTGSVLSFYIIDHQGYLH